MIRPKAEICGSNFDKVVKSPSTGRGRVSPGLGSRRITMLKLKSKQWIVDENDNIIMGEGRRKIFENIEKTGSINQTSKVMKMSYKAAWAKIKASENHLNTRLVDSDRKMGSSLTQEGKMLLKQYQLLKKRCLTEDNRIFSKIFSKKETP